MQAYWLIDKDYDSQSMDDNPQWLVGRIISNENQPGAQGSLAATAEIGLLPLIPMKSQILEDLTNSLGEIPIEFPMQFRHCLTFRFWSSMLILCAPRAPRSPRTFSLRHSVTNILPQILFLKTLN